MNWVDRLADAASAALVWACRGCTDESILALLREAAPEEAAPDSYAVLRRDVLGEAALAMQGGEEVRFAAVRRDFALGELAELCLWLALAAARRPVLGRVFLHFWGQPGATLEAARDILAANRPRLPVAHADCEEAFARLEPLLLPAPSGESFLRRLLTADERVFGFLSGSDLPDALLRPFCERVPCEDEPPPLYARQNTADELAALLRFDREPYPAAVHLAGPRGCGKRLILRHACRRAGLDLLFCDAAALCRLPEARRAEAVLRLGRESLLTGACVCLHRLGAAAQALPEAVRAGFSQRFLSELRPLIGGGLPVFLCSGEDFDALPYLDEYAVRVDVPAHSMPERVALWEGYARAYGLPDDFPCGECGSKFRLSAREIEKAVRRLASFGEGAPLTAARIEQVCRDMIPFPRAGNILPVETTYTFADLILPEEQKQTLLDVCGHVWRRHQVYDEWELRRRYAYGRNVSLLMTGPPGTGKTMAAHVLSNLLGLPLYQVNLSQVVDKYIGETEKRLEEIFETADRCSCILFFDEADSIFGKRSEVQDAHDRYANTEVSYILQRMERFDGIVLLASNFKKNIDEAFMRRIRYYIEFNMPDEELREKIWRGCFTAKVPAERLDFSYLARQFELSGGSIRNVALNAVFLAACEEAPVSMRHLIKSLRQEHLKQGKALFREDFGVYGHLL